MSRVALGTASGAFTASPAQILADRSWRLGSDSDNCYVVEAGKIRVLGENCSSVWPSWSSGSYAQSIQRLAPVASPPFLECNPPTPCYRSVRRSQVASPVSRQPSVPVAGDLRRGLGPWRGSCRVATCLSWTGRQSRLGFVAAMAVLRLRFGGSSCWALIGATLALAIAVLMPARADAFGTFANGVLTVSGGEGKIVPRCASDGEITVSGVSVDNGPAYCRDLRRIEASSSNGGRGDDILRGGSAADKLLGGPGRDTEKQ